MARCFQKESHQRSKTPKASASSPRGDGSQWMGRDIRACAHFPLPLHQVQAQSKVSQTSNLTEAHENLQQKRQRNWRSFLSRVVVVYSSGRETANGQTGGTSPCGLRLQGTSAGRQGTTSPCGLWLQGPLQGTSREIAKEKRRPLSLPAGLLFPACLGAPFTEVRYKPGTSPL